MTDVDIRECRADDVPLLETHLPSPGANRYHEARYRRQAENTSTFLVAWDGDRPVAVGEIRWNGCAAPEVRASFPGCPEINGLDVAEDRRSRGIGTALLATAETCARNRGYHHIGLGVDDDNPRAAALYLRLGYRETGCRYLDRYSYVDADGSSHDVADPARFLVKDLG
ncbi:GNAT family N-acetyltransferase [Amycolatopsis sp. NPDC059027]|uniref:GNAT family N-acetyltransferase n=1 Tax=unclassified Amycolatopsis TaxID=2618356 RepID=UPI00366A75EC